MLVLWYEIEVFISLLCGHCVTPHRRGFPQSSPACLLWTPPRDGERSEVSGAGQSQSQRPTAFPPYQPAAQRCMQCSHRRRGWGPEEGLSTRASKPLSHTQNSNQSKWISILTDVETLFANTIKEQSRHSMQLNTAVVLALQRFPTDRAYFIAKELLTTERTYLKDLEVVTVVRWASPTRHSAVWFPLLLSSGKKNTDYSG